jgi:Flp pilus assembly protein CpaB
MTVVNAEAVATKVVLSNEIDPTLRTSYTNVVGQVLVTPMVEGEAFTDAHFAHEGSGVNLAAALPEGFRAMSAMLTDDSGIIDLLYPGCVVDVIASFRLPSSEGVASGEVISVTLLQGVQVLAIGPRSVVTGSSDTSSQGPEGDRRERRRVTLM